jgi:succinate-semialdehyde dehydrogenase
MENHELIASMIEKARTAQKVLSTYPQEKIDELVRVMAKIVYDNAEVLARMAVEETRMGIYEDKVAKNKGKARILWNALKGKKSVGILRYIEEEGIVEVAKPMGVVGAVTPCTNPIVTPMCNAMFAIKGGNAIIIAPHPRGKIAAKHIEGLYNAAFKKLGAPENIFQVLEEPSIELTNLLMKAVDVVIATGGMGMVKAAYSSGKPSYGVGAGNVQCILDRDVDFTQAVPKIIAGRIFDNGIICSGEQTIITHKDDCKAVLDEFIKNGAYYTENTEEVDRLRRAIFSEGEMSKYVVGQSAAMIAELAGVDIPVGTKLIIVKPKGFGEDDLFSKEKMCPVMSVYTYSDWKEAVSIALANLEIEGKGHSCAVHSNTKENVEYAGTTLPVSRVLVNQICATMNGGSFFNGLSATTTLGCGSWGNNSISENLTYTHLFNKARIAYVKPGATQPPDEEIWG